MKSTMKHCVAALMALSSALAFSATSSTPKLLINMRSRATPETSAALSAEESGWCNWKQDSDPYIPAGGKSANKYLQTSGECANNAAGPKFRVNSGGGNFRSEWGGHSGKSFAEGSYTNIFGQVHTSLVDEVKSSLCLPQNVNFTTNVYDEGIGNGGQNNCWGEIAGLSTNSKYVVYVGYGKQRVNNSGSNYPVCSSAFKLKQGKFGEIDSLDYVVTAGTNGSVVANHYVPFTASNETCTVSYLPDNLMIVRYVGKPNSAGEIQFELCGDKSGMTFLAVSELAADATHTATLTGEQNWSELTWNPAAGGSSPAFSETDILQITASESATLVFDQIVDIPATLTILGTVTIKVGDSLIENGCYQKRIARFGAFSAPNATITQPTVRKATCSIDGTGVTALVQSAEVFSVNFAGGYPVNGNIEMESESSCRINNDTGILGLAPVPGNSWNEMIRRWSSGRRTFPTTTFNAYDGTNVIQRKSIEVMATANNTFHDTDINNCKFLRGYLDDSGEGVKVEITGIPYSNYDLIVYCTSDNASYQLAPVGINGTNYMWSSEENAVVTTNVNNAAWGEARHGTPEYGKNALLVTNLTGQTLTIASTRASNGPRATLAAIQIVNKGTVTPPQVFTATISESKTLESITYDSSATYQDGEFNSVELTVSGADTESEVVITIQNPTAKLAKVKVTSENGRKVKFASQNNSEISGIGIIELGTVATIPTNFTGKVKTLENGSLMYIATTATEELPVYSYVGAPNITLGSEGDGVVLEIKKTAAAEYSFETVKVIKGTVKVGTDTNNNTYKFAAKQLIVDNATFDIGSRDAIDNVQSIIATNSATLRTGAFNRIPETKLASSRIELTNGYSGGWKNWCQKGKLLVFGESSITKMENANVHTSVELMNGEFWVAEGGTLTVNAPIVDRPTENNVSATLPNQIKKTGPGTMVFTDTSGACYSGITKVEAGKLVYNKQRTGTTTSQNFTVAVGATLSGNGAVKGAAKVILAGTGSTVAGSLSIDNLQVADGASLGGAADPMTNLTINTALGATGASQTLKVINGTASIASAATVTNSVKFNVTTSAGNGGATVTESVLGIGTKRDLTIGGNGALAVELTEEESKTPQIELFTADDSLGKTLTIKSLKVGEKEFTQNSRGLIYSDTKGILKVWIRGMLLLFR